MTTTVDLNNKGTAVNRVLHHCDTCKATFQESVQYAMGKYIAYQSPEERKELKKAAAARSTVHVPQAAVPVVAGLRSRGNAAI